MVTLVCEERGEDTGRRCGEPVRHALRSRETQLCSASELDAGQMVEEHGPTARTPVAAEAGMGGAGESVRWKADPGHGDLGLN